MSLQTSLTAGRPLRKACVARLITGRGWTRSMARSGQLEGTTRRLVVSLLRTTLDSPSTIPRAAPSQMTALYID
jgi:hypothetical protein